MSVRTHIEDSMTGSSRSVKRSGRIFTPKFLVDIILDCASYRQGNILRKHVIDNSCGNGAFLCEVVVRYCSEYLSLFGSVDGLKRDLQTYIHGIESDSAVADDCRRNLSAVAERFGVSNVNWNIVNRNALSVTDFDGRMDFVVGNPPYVRVHNLADDYDVVKSFGFARGGMTDLYLAFYELGLRMLGQRGRLCYITPSSWLTSLAAADMRKYIIVHRNLAELTDLGHYQAFENATTYTMIALFDMAHESDTVEYYSYSPERKERVHVDTLLYDEMNIDDKFYIAARRELTLLKAIKSASTSKYVRVKNGFATLADKVFLSNVPFDDFTIPVLKASTGEWCKGFFPYDSDGRPISEEEIFSHKRVAEYLNENKAELLKGKTERENPCWYLYGRTQALKDVRLRKYSVNTIIKDKASIRLNVVPKGAGVYSGLYILTDVPFDVIGGALRSDDFIMYLTLLKSYKSGGYYTYTSKDLEQYLNYKISLNG